MTAYAEGKWWVEMKNANRHAQPGHERAGLELRRPACLVIRDLRPKDFTCTLTRCPQTFVRLDLSTGPHLPAQSGTHDES